MGSTSSKVKERYNQKAYDRIALRVPKGYKEELKQAALDSGHDSLNQFIAEAIEYYRKGIEEGRQ